MSESLTNKTSSPLPFPCYFWTVTVICLLGLAAAVSLIGLPLSAVHGPGLQQLLRHLESHQLRYRLTIPVCSALGGSGRRVGLFSPICLFSSFCCSAWVVRRIISGSGHCSSAWRLDSAGTALCWRGLSTFVIGSYCILCIALYAVNLLLLFFSWIVRRRFNSGPFFRALGEDLRHLSPKETPERPRYSRTAGGFRRGQSGLPAYWLFNPAPMPAQIATGVTSEGRPWIGAESPALEIIEFADYQCFQCKKMYYHLRDLIAKYPEKIRLVHVHYPMDHEFNPMVKTPFHIGSGKMALLAVYAAAEGKFWDVHDLLYQWAGNRQEIDLHELASMTDLPADRLAEATENLGFREKLAADIRFGMQHGGSGDSELFNRGKDVSRYHSPGGLRGDCRLMNGSDMAADRTCSAEGAPRNPH